MDDWEEIENRVYGAERLVWETNNFGSWRIQVTGQPTTTYKDKATSRLAMLKACDDALGRHTKAQQQIKTNRLADQAAQAEAKLEQENRAILSKHPFFGRF